MKTNPTASEMGKAGGKARAEKLSSKRKKEIATKAAKTRWGKSKQSPR